MTRRRNSRPVERHAVIYYYAGGRLGIDNWSRKTYAIDNSSARQRAVVRLITEQWSKAVIKDRYTDRTLSTLVHTSWGIRDV